MAHKLIIQGLDRASRARNFSELRASLGNDLLSDWRDLYNRATERSLAPDFFDGTDRDWEAFTSLVILVQRSVDFVNHRLADCDWGACEQVDQALTNLPTPSPVIMGDAEDARIVAALAEIIQQYSVLGHCDQVGTDRLFDVLSGEAAPILDAKRHDVFVSYKTARNADIATKLVSELEARSYKVWFDKIALAHLSSEADCVPKDHLVTRIQHGVRQSKCIALFPITSSMVQPMAGRTGHDMQVDRTAIRGPHEATVAWSWQTLELNTATRGLVIYPRTIEVFGAPRARPEISIPVADVPDSVRAVLVALDYLGVYPASAVPPGPVGEQG